MATEARRKGCDQWKHCGDMSDVDAAIFVSSFYSDDDLTVEVRSTDRPGDVRSLRVKRRTAYEVKELPKQAKE